MLGYLFCKFVALPMLKEAIVHYHYAAMLVTEMSECLL